MQTRGQKMISGSQDFWLTSDTSKKNVIVHVSQGDKKNKNPGVEGEGGKTILLFVLWVLLHKILKIQQKILE